MRLLAALASLVVLTEGRTLSGEKKRREEGGGTESTEAPRMRGIWPGHASRFGLFPRARAGRAAGVAPEKTTIRRLSANRWLIGSISA